MLSRQQRFYACLAKDLFTRIPAQGDQALPVEIWNVNKQKQTKQTHREKSVGMC